MDEESKNVGTMVDAKTKKSFTPRFKVESSPNDVKIKKENSTEIKKPKKLNKELKQMEPNPEKSIKKLHETIKKTGARSRNQKQKTTKTTPMPDIEEVPELPTHMSGIRDTI